jgi:hypothetical protein
MRARAGRHERGAGGSLALAHDHVQERTVRISADQLLRLTARVLLAVAVWVPVTTAARADELLLVDGSRIAGTITEDTPEVVTIRTQDGTQTILRSRIIEIVRGGQPTPSSREGKVSYKGRWVTPEEKAQLEAGRILYKGQWIHPDEKPYVDKGLVRYKQRWVSAAEKAMLERGLARFEGKWLPREEVEALRRQWANAWEVSTKRFLVRSNTSEEEAYEMLHLLDDAVNDFKHLLATPKAEPSKPMVVYVFREAASYEEWCRSKDAHVYLAQPDFYDTKENILALCRRDLPLTVFQPWAVGAAFSQFVWTCFDTKFPEWFEYGIRCYYQGSRVKDGKLEAGSVYKAMLPDFQNAISTGRHLKLRQVVGLSAATVAGSATFQLFQAEAWSLIHFFRHEKEGKWRKPFEKLVDQYLKADFSQHADVGVINELGLKIFDKVFGKDQDALETEWLAYSRRLD